MGAHRHGLRRELRPALKRHTIQSRSNGRRRHAARRRLVGHSARVRLEAARSGTQRAKAVVLDAPPKWAPALMSAARDRALAPVFVSEGVKARRPRARVKGATAQSAAEDATPKLSWSARAAPSSRRRRCWMGDDVAKALVAGREGRGGLRQRRSRGDTTTPTVLVIAVPDATALMNRAFAAFAYTLEGGGAALVANVAVRRVARGGSPWSTPRRVEAEHAPPAARRAAGSSRCWRWPSGSRLAGRARHRAEGRGREDGPSDSRARTPPVVSETSDVTSRTRTRMNGMDDSEEEEEAAEPRAVARPSCRRLASPIAPRRVRAVGRVRGGARSTESDDETRVRADSGDEDEAAPGTRLGSFARARAGIR